MAESSRSSRAAALLGFFRGRTLASRVRVWSLLTLAVVVSWLVVSCALRVHARDRVLSGVWFEDRDVSGLTRSPLDAVIRSWGAARAKRPMALNALGRPASWAPEAAGFEVDVARSAAAVLAAGREGSFARGLSQYVTRAFVPERVSASVRFDPARLSKVLDEWEASATEPTPFGGGLSISGGSVAARYPRPGSRLDRPRVEQRLLHAARMGIDAGVLPSRQEQPRVPRAEVDRVAQVATNMLAQAVELSTADGTRRLRVAPAEIGALVRVSVADSGDRLELSCSSDGAHALLESERKNLERAPENARFVIDSSDQVHIVPGITGLKLRDASVAEALCRAAQKPEKAGELPLEAGEQPAFPTEAAERAGIVGLVGSYTTRHACCQPRVQNIHHIADLLDGQLVLPGATFSVNQLVGPRTLKNGFRPAPSIEDGDMVDTVGGGVSQFATTLFNALFYGGYDIVERQPHTYWFTRYPMGYDATLSYPHPDIVFKNDTEAAALLETAYTDTSITVKVYGNNGGRRVRAEVSERQSIVTPPLELIPNPRLEPDEEKTREGGMIGWTVVVKRTLTFADGKIKEERRKVTYKPRARRVEVHPCRIPAGQPGHTGERCPQPEKEPDDSAASSDTGAK